jgi:hypothetical protein
MPATTDDAKRDRTFWRGMYLMAFLIGAVVPIACIIAVGVATSESAWRSIEVPITAEQAAGRPDVYWRQQSVAVPVGESITYRMENRAFERRHSEGSFLLLGMAWSGTTLICMAGVAAAAWIVLATAEKLGIDRSRGYLRGMFFMAFVTGAVVPIAAIIAAGANTADAPSVISTSGAWLLIVMWCGMIAVCIAGLFSAAWLVKTAATKLRPAADPVSAGERYPSPFIAEPTLERQYHP